MMEEANSLHSNNIIKMHMFVIRVRLTLFHINKTNIRKRRRHSAHKIWKTNPTYGTHVYFINDNPEQMILYVEIQNRQGRNSAIRTQTRVLLFVLLLRGCCGAGASLSLAFNLLWQIQISGN